MAQKLTDMQLVLLATACQRDDGSLLPPPSSLGDQSARIRKAVIALIKRDFASEQDVTDTGKIWREEGERHIGVAVTDAGRAVVAAEEADSEPAQVEPGMRSPVPGNPALAGSEPNDMARTGTKQALVLDLLRRDSGATLADLVAATGWLPHTTRAALTGLRKKNHGILTEKLETGTRYRIAEVA
jgi:hypothetical protein